MRNAHLKKSALFLTVLLVTPCSFARSETPDLVPNTAAVEVTAILKQDAETSTAGARTNAADLVEARILTLFDFPHMTQIAMARNWRLASAEQQALLISEFKTLLVHRYAVALSSYPEPVLEFKRPRLSADDTVVRVKSEVKQPGGESMAIDYDMAMTPAGWRVYDIKVAGVSLITTYREAFAYTVRTEGIDGLIKTLSTMNRQAESGVNTVKMTFLDRSRIIFAMLQSALQGRR